MADWCSSKRSSASFNIPSASFTTLMGFKMELKVMGIEEEECEL